MKFFLVFLTFLATTLSANVNDWTVFVKEFNSQKIAVSFPEDPETVTKDDQFFASYKESNVQYFLLLEKFEGCWACYIHQLLDQNTLKQQIEKSFTDFGKIIEMNSSGLCRKGNFSVIDIFCKSDRGEYLRGRIFLSPESKMRYDFFTIYSDGAQENHDFFISSFSIEK